MAVNWIVVQAYRERYSKAELIQVRNQAVDDLASGVLVTQVTFEGGGASGQRLATGDPAYLLEHAQMALSDETPGSRASSSFMDLSNRNFGT